MICNVHKTISFAKPLAFLPDANDNVTSATVSITIWSMNLGGSQISVRTSSKESVGLQVVTTL
jgi:hypothetical protein